MRRTVPILTLAVAVAACGESPLGPDDVGLQLQARCVGGFAEQYPCEGIDLWAYVALDDLEPGLDNFASVSDVWGWTDPVTGSEYALVGRSNGLTIVDLSRPHDPRPVGRLASPTIASTWRDVKVYNDHAYIVADASDGHGIQVLDLTRLRDVEQFTDFDADGRYLGVSSVHNIAINEETGFAYSVGNAGGGTTCGGGLHMLDLANPTNPLFVGCFAELGTGRTGSGYTHDVQCVVYRGPDTDHQGREVCVASNETAVVTVDVTDKSNPTTLGTGTYPDFGYIHQGWLSEDHRFFYQNDESDELSGTVNRTRMLVWDLTDLDDPILAREHLGPSGAIDHNLYVHDGRIYHSNYTFGMRVLDIADPANPTELGYFDTVVADDAANFGGSWSNYPYFESGAIVVTSSREGIFILRMQD